MSQLIKVVDWTGERRGTVIFVHGLGGHPYDTWRRGTGPVASDDTFWPKWLAEGISGIEVYTLGYEATPSGWFGEPMAIEHRVNNIAELLFNEEGLARSHITFVCHSLGGIIVKKLLLHLDQMEAVEPRAKALLDGVRQVAFLATPHLGSDHANLIDRLRLLLWPSPLTTALVANAPALHQTNITYRALAKGRAGSLRHKVLYETRSTVLGKIVREGSADPGLSDSAPIATDSNHITIARPKDRGSEVFGSLRSFIAKALPPAEKSAAGDLVLPGLPEFDDERTIDYLGILTRVTMLALIVATLWFAAIGLLQRHDGGPRRDFVEVLDVLTRIENDDDRVRVAEAMLNRQLGTGERQRIRLMRSGPVRSVPLAPEFQTRIARATNPADLSRVLAEIDLKPCGGSFAFKVDGATLVCADGRPVPQVPVPGALPELRSAEAVIFHYTASGSTTGVLNFLAGGTAPNNVSYHILVARSGAVVQLVPLDREARHAGQSYWQTRGLTQLNAYSIGVSFTNQGRLTQRDDGTYVNAYGAQVGPKDVVPVQQAGQTSYWDRYTDDQMRTAEGLVHAFRARKPNIELLGHSEVSPRSLDPGPAFPIDRLRQIR
ncbi:MAG: N-acetylmuramoyl-L-alanine amidase [Phreatobacter sp.]|uniref:N-acetylmuramoyl-L-alanine amidase n=1 Tax=Phreatobacter sp. TaxID=1966341 RepID=UPI00273374C6|nr:N-acetylmuramoyl-L-alanine amidase [Phreatobacter sp.]MDP2803231.1 N-acetylmuramoyl-L-alanine amidase [Phreatobacter sp.]